MRNAAMKNIRLDHEGACSHFTDHSRPFAMGIVSTRHVICAIDRTTLNGNLLTVLSDMIITIKVKSTENSFRHGVMEHRRQTTQITH